MVPSRGIYISSKKFNQNKTFWKENKYNYDTVQYYNSMILLQHSVNLEIKFIYYHIYVLLRHFILIQQAE